MIVLEPSRTLRELRGCGYMHPLWPEARAGFLPLRLCTLPYAHAPYGQACRYSPTLYVRVDDRTLQQDLAAAFDYEAPGPHLYDWTTFRLGLERLQIAVSDDLVPDEEPHESRPE